MTRYSSTFTCYTIFILQVHQWGIHATPISGSGEVYEAFPIRSPQSLFIPKVRRIFSDDTLSNKLPQITPLDATEEVGLKPFFSAFSQPSPGLDAEYSVDFASLEGEPSPSQAPEPSYEPVSLSGFNSNGSVNGVTNPAFNLIYTVGGIVLVATAITIVFVALYGGTINPYRPFVTGASFSDNSLEVSQRRRSSFLRFRARGTGDPCGTGGGRPRRYEAESLERDVGVSEHSEAALQVQDVPDRTLQFQTSTSPRGTRRGQVMGNDI